MNIEERKCQRIGGICVLCIEGYLSMGKGGNAALCRYIRVRRAGFGPRPKLLRTLLEKSKVECRDGLRD